MNRPKLIQRIESVIKLQPMTIQCIADCLSASYRATQVEVAILCKHNLIKVVGKTNKAVGMPRNVNVYALVKP